MITMIRPGGIFLLVALVCLLEQKMGFGATLEDGQATLGRMKRQAAAVSPSGLQLSVSAGANQDASRPVASLAGQLGGTSALAPGSGLTGQAQLGALGLTGTLGTRRPNVQPAPMIVDVDGNVLGTGSVPGGLSNVAKPARRRPSVSEDDEDEEDEDEDYVVLHGGHNDCVIDLDNLLHEEVALKPFGHANHLLGLFGKLRGLNDEDLKIAAGTNLGPGGTRSQVPSIVGNRARAIVETKERIDARRSKSNDPDEDDEANDYDQDDDES